MAKVERAAKAAPLGNPDGLFGTLFVGISVSWGDNIASEDEYLGYLSNFNDIGSALFRFLLQQ